MKITKLKVFALFMVVFSRAGIYAQQNQPSVFQPQDGIPKTRYGDNLDAGHYIHADDARIYFEIYGSGRPIVLHHGGLLGSIGEMSDFIGSLKPNYQAIAMSTCRHGKSEIGTALITYELKANDVMAVVNAVTKGRVIHSGVQRWSLYGSQSGKRES